MKWKIVNVATCQRPTMETFHVRNEFFLFFMLRFTHKWNFYSFVEWKVVLKSTIRLTVFHYCTIVDCRMQLLHCWENFHFSLSIRHRRWIWWQRWCKVIMDTFEWWWHRGDFLQLVVNGTFFHPEFVNSSIEGVSPHCLLRAVEVDVHII